MSDITGRNGDQYEYVRAMVDGMLDEIHVEFEDCADGVGAAVLEHEVSDLGDEDVQEVVSTALDLETGAELIEVKWL